MPTVHDPGAALDAKQIKLEPGDVQMGPLGYLAAERERMDGLRWESFVDHLVGVDRDESFALLDLLCRQAELPEHQCRWHWEADSVAFWDNRAVQHYACSDYWPSVRVMERASIIGTKPV